MEHRINTELAEQERRAEEKTRRRWPDDGLAAPPQDSRPSEPASPGRAHRRAVLALEGP